ncbi:unnamed protein product (macronuclear) [Paramecium tetraurelia]|uniref:RING-type domain-containing protein n=1 Tax=Paramecium tetraurelia TaxID=5888 RepID=A0BU68_PARTE|nr:uncharacterized protein GSPATT00032317001 [Paramecium tetraurelia]CAK62085.1 unnamed protein product [Paramecium tetraurelia]|eukprot:XP_001429483.1 hypothetical protein (macronuclear) [Paramecium tetraurelia strain d4-2]
MNKQQKKTQKQNEKLKIQSQENDSPQNIEDIIHDKNDFICPICLNYIVAAVSLKCGHTFCEICLHEYLLYFKGCHICNDNMRKSKFAYCYLLDQMIHEFIKSHHPEELKTYEMAKISNKEWRKKKQVQSIDVGQQIDVRDPNFVWNVGTIKRLKISQEVGKIKYLVIHYEGKSDKHDEEIAENSPRFAALGFYTSRNDIPKYYKQTKNPFLKNLLYIECMDPNDNQFNQQFFIEDNSSESE